MLSTCRRAVTALDGQTASLVKYFGMGSVDVVSVDCRPAPIQTIQRKEDRIPMNLCKRLAMTVLVFALCSAPLFGQAADTALIVGSVTDATGAVVPGTNVTFAHLATGSEYTAQSNETGSFRSPPLRIGEYIVIAESEGFKQYSGSGITLSIGDTRQLDITLEIGAVTEVIEVEAAAPLLQTTEASAGTVIENRQIVDLPLNGRDYLQLALISAGVAPSRGQGVSIGGQRGSEVGFMMDGMDNNNQSIASQGRQKEVVKPNVDAISEFKVITNGFSAEYGRSSAGIISLAIKSGTNDLHGTGFYFMRDENLDARHYFANPDAEKPQFGRKQYGFAIGGPIKRNRSFLFGDAEWTDIRETATFVSNVPTPAMRGGDFSAFDRNIYDPNTLADGVRSQFPDNRIPENRIDPVTNVMRNWWPDPQREGLTRNYTFQPPRTQDFYKWDIRWDHNLTSTDNLFARWSSQQQVVNNPPRLPATEFGSLTRGGPYDVTSNNAVVGWNRVWNAALVSNFRVGWNYIDSDIETHLDIPGNVNSQIGLMGVNQDLRGVSEMGMTPWREIGTNTFRPNLIQSQTRQFSADNTLTRGNHAIKFGAQLFWLQSFIDNPQRTMGTIIFDGRFSEESPTDRGGGDSLADFLLGYPREMFGSNTVYMNMRAPFLHFYAQDDWKVTDKLTLNLGVRYENNAPWIETRDGIGLFQRGGHRGSQGAIRIAGQTGSSWADRAMIDRDNNNFAPRLGWAYRLNEKTVIRGAYGVFYGNITNTGGGEFMETMPPFHFKATLTTGRADPFLRMREGLPAGTITAENARGVEMSAWDEDPAWPMAQNWNLNIQRTVFTDVLWEFGYFGNKMNHVMGRWDESAPRPGESVYDPVLGQTFGPGSSPNERRPWKRVFVPTAQRGDVQFPGNPYQGEFAPGCLCFITLGRQNTHSNRWNTLYHGFHTKLEKRYSQGMTYIVSYQWSHAIGDIRAIPGSGGSPGESARLVLDVLDLTRERGNNPTDQRHRFVGSVVYELPWGRGKRFGSGWGGLTDALLGGWSAGTIMTFSSGTPATPTVRGNPANIGGGDRPNVVSGQGVNVSNQDPAGWWNADAFSPNSTYTFGDAGKGILRGPGRAVWDFSAYKQFRFTEKYTAQFRLEAFNFTNTPQFNFPNVQVGNRNYGIISGAGRPRNLQIGLKFIF